MRKECKKRERQKRERITDNITYRGQHFPVLYHSMLTICAGVKLVLMTNIELTVSHLIEPKKKARATISRTDFFKLATHEILGTY